MPTQGFSVTQTPQNIVTPLSLASGTTYLAQNTGNTIVSLGEFAATPDKSVGHALQPYQTLQITVSGDGIWVWTRAAHGGRIAVTEAS